MANLHLRLTRVSDLLWAGVAGRTRQASRLPWGAGSLRPRVLVGISRRGGRIVGWHTSSVGGLLTPRTPCFLGSFRSQQCFSVSSREAKIRLPVTFALVMSFAATQSEPESFSVTLSPRLGEPATMPAFPSHCEKPLASWPSPSPGNLWVPQSLDHLVTGPRHALRPRPTGLPTCAVSCEAPERVGISRRQ